MLEAHEATDERVVARMRVVGTLPTDLAIQRELGLNGPVAIERGLAHETAKSRCTDRYEQRLLRQSPCGQVVKSLPHEVGSGKLGRKGHHLAPPLSSGDRVAARSASSTFAYSVSASTAG